MPFALPEAEERVTRRRKSMLTFSIEDDADRSADAEEEKGSERGRRVPPSVVAALVELRQRLHRNRHYMQRVYDCFLLPQDVERSFSLGSTAFASYQSTVPADVASSKDSAGVHRTSQHEVHLELLGAADVSEETFTSTQQGVCTWKAFFRALRVLGIHSAAGNLSKAIHFASCCGILTAESVEFGKLLNLLRDHVVLLPSTADQAAAVTPGKSSNGEGGMEVLQQSIRRSIATDRHFSSRGLLQDSFADGGTPLHDSAAVSPVSRRNPNGSGRRLSKRGKVVCSLNLDSISERRATSFATENGTPRASVASVTWHRRSRPTFFLDITGPPVEMATSVSVSAATVQFVMDRLYDTRKIVRQRCADWAAIANAAAAATVNSSEREMAAMQTRVAHQRDFLMQQEEDVNIGEPPSTLASPHRPVASQDGNEKGPLKLENGSAMPIPSNWSPDTSPLSGNSDNSKNKKVLPATPTLSVEATTPTRRYSVKVSADTVSATNITTSIEFFQSAVEAEMRHHSQTPVKALAVQQNRVSLCFWPTSESAVVPPAVQQSVQESDFVMLESPKALGRHNLLHAVSLTEKDGSNPLSSCTPDRSGGETMAVTLTPTPRSASTRNQIPDQHIPYSVLLNICLEIVGAGYRDTLCSLFDRCELCEPMSPFSEKSKDGLPDHLVNYERQLLKCLRVASVPNRIAPEEERQQLSKLSIQELQRLMVPF